MSHAVPKWIAALPLAGLLAACAGATQPSPATTAQTSPAANASGFQRALIDFKSCAKPEYPRDDLRASHTGRVKLGFLVSVDGAVLDSRIEQSSGYQGLDVTAQAVLSKCRFRPARLDGQAVQAWAEVSYVWSIVDDRRT
jgi:protein TonB